MQSLKVEVVFLLRFLSKRAVFVKVVHVNTKAEGNEMAIDKAVGVIGDDRRGVTVCTLGIA